MRFIVLVVLSSLVWLAGASAQEYSYSRDDWSLELDVRTTGLAKVTVDTRLTPARHNRILRVGLISPGGKYYKPITRERLSVKAARQMNLGQTPGQMTPKIQHPMRFTFEAYQEMGAWRLGITVVDKKGRRHKISQLLHLMGSPLLKGEHAVVTGGLGGIRGDKRASEGVLTQILGTADHDSVR